MAIMKIKLLTILTTLSIASCSTTSQLVNEELLRIGMSIKAVCEVTSTTTSVVEDPCYGSYQYFNDKNILALWNENKTSFLIFENVINSNPFSDSNRRSSLIMITSSDEEALFFIENVLE